MNASPRLLVTGFSVFPGAPVNPTEALVARLAKHPPEIDASFRAELLAVEYGSLGARLDAVAKAFAPDIAIHFGLARECTGFRLERLARNEILAGRPDNAGHLPMESLIVEGGVHLPSTLPLTRIAGRLGDAGLPVSFSDDAGGYLCNYLFYLSASRLHASFSPGMFGFVHVPPSRESEPENPHAMTLDDLDRGALVIIRECLAAWRENRASA